MRTVTLQDLINRAPEEKTLQTLHNMGLISTTGADGKPVVFNLVNGGDGLEKQAIYDLLAAQIHATQRDAGVPLPRRWLSQIGNETQLKADIAEAVSNYYKGLALV